MNTPRKISDILPSICQKLLKSVEIFLTSDKNKSAQFLRHGVDSSLRQSILTFTSVTSALEVFLKQYALYNSTFYLLTYLLTRYALPYRIVSHYQDRLNAARMDHKLQQIAAGGSDS